MAQRSRLRSEPTGPRLRAAALRLFARHGYAAVSMRQIAAEVGVQVGALYNYIPDKQGLLLDLMQSHLEDLLAAWQAESKDAAPLKALEAFTRFHIRFHLERPDAVFIAYMELRNLTPENFAVIETLRKSYETALADILSAGQEVGAFHLADTRLATRALIAMLTGVNTWYRDGGELGPEAVADRYWTLVRNAVGASARPTPE